MAGPSQIVWTPEAVSRLTQLRQAGLPATQIALAMGMSYGAVQTAISRYQVKRTPLICRPCSHCRVPFNAETRFIRLCAACKSSSDIMCGA